MFSDTVSLLADGTGRVNFYALNTGSGTGTKIIGIDETVSASLDSAGTQPAKMVFGFVGASRSSPVDVAGRNAPDPYHSDRTFINILGDSSGGATGTENDPTLFEVIQTDPANSHRPGRCRTGTSTLMAPSASTTCSSSPATTDRHNLRWMPWMSRSQWGSWYWASG